MPKPSSTLASKLSSADNGTTHVYRSSTGRNDSPAEPMARRSPCRSSIRIGLRFGSDGSGIGDQSHTLSLNRGAVGRFTALPVAGGQVSSGRPTVAVIVPTYNHARFLAAAIRSITAQSQPADEILVVDDGSQDDPASVLRGFSDVKLLRRENGGLAAARNTGPGRHRG